MGLGQWIIIIVLVAIILFGFAAVFDFGKGIIKNVYPTIINIDDSPPSSSFIIGNVTKVIDGDTIDIEGDGEERIRFTIVNTPERGQDGYQEAKQFTKDKCLGKDAIIDLDDSQPRTYGRLVGVVYCDSYFINLGLLQQDLAVVVPQYCKYSEFKDGVLCQYKIE